MVGALLLIAATARADGAMVYRERELFRQGPAARGYCDPDGSGPIEECDHVLTKELSGYSYGRGHVAGAAALDPSSGVNGVGALHASGAAAALPGADAALGSVDGFISSGGTQRVRVTLLDVQGAFFCRDSQTGALVAPLLGMFTRKCAPDAMLAIDLGLLALQWDLDSARVLGEWARLGPAVELLSNGFGYAHLRRSIELGLPFDLSSLRDRELDEGSETSLGVGLRVSAFYRSPHWEARLTARHRTTLIGRAGALADHSVEGELLLLRNVFLSDAIVLQAGLTVRACWSEQPARTPALWASVDQRASAFAGLYLGWAHEPPDI